MVWRYCLSVLKRAGKDWLEFFDLHHVGGWAKLLLPSFISAAIQLRLLGLETMLRELSGTTFVYGLGVLGWVIVVFLFLLSLAPARLDKEKQDSIEKLRNDKDDLFEKQKPKLEITYHEQPPYQQMMPIPIYIGPSAPMPERRLPEGTQKWIRVGVHNLSPVESIDGLHVELAQIDPNIIHNLPMPLSFMHGENRSSLNPDEIRYVDVLSIFQDAKEPPYSDNFVIHHSVTRQSGLIPNSHTYRFTIIARGKNVPAVSNHFLLGIGADYQYHFMMERDI